MCPADHPLAVSRRSGVARSRPGNVCATLYAQTVDTREAPRQEVPPNTLVQRCPSAIPAPAAEPGSPPALPAPPWSQSTSKSNMSSLRRTGSAHRRDPHRRPDASRNTILMPYDRARGGQRTPRSRVTHSDLCGDGCRHFAGRIIRRWTRAALDPIPGPGTTPPPHQAQTRRAEKLVSGRHESPRV